MSGRGVLVLVLCSGMRREGVQWLGEAAGAFTRWAAEGIKERTYSCSDRIQRVGE